MRKRENLVYMAECVVNGKCYFGATTTSLAARKSQHKIAAIENLVDNKFYRAIRKHGFANFTFKIVARCVSPEVMFSIERQLIAIHHSTVNGYNTTIGGEGRPGCAHSESARKNMSIGQRIRFSRKEERDRASAAARQFYISRPENAEEILKRRVETLRSEECRRHAREKQLAFLSANPEAPKRQGDALRILYSENPDIAARISRSLGGRPIEALKDGIKVARFETIMAAARALGVNHGNLRLVLRGKRSHAGGFQFRYEDACPGGAVPANAA